MHNQDVQDVLDQIKRDLEREALGIDADIYNEESLDAELDNDTITARESAFMRGWHTAD